MLSKQRNLIRVTLSMSLGVLVMACGQNLSDTEYLLRAHALKSKDDLNAAIIEAKNALQQNPKNGEARLLLASLYNDQGDGVAAESNLIRAKELGISPDIIEPPLARALFLQQQYQKIVDTISVPETFDSKTRAKLLAARAEARLMLGELNEATQDIELALNADANSPSALIAAARQKLYKNEPNLALEFEDRAQKAAPNDLDVWLYKGEAALTRGGFSDAQRAYDFASKLPESTLSAARKFEIQLGLASSLLAQNKDDDALPHINTMLAINSKHQTPNYLRGVIAYRKADYTKAVDYLQRSIAQPTQISTSLALLGASNFALGNFQQAEDFLNKYLADHPKDDSARKLLAATQIQLKKPEQAVKTLGAIKKLTQESAEILKMLGTAAAMMNDPRVGRAVLKKAVASAPDNVYLHTKLAESYYREGEFDQALQELEKTSKNQATALQSRMSIVLTYLRKNESGPALKLAQSLAQEHPTEPIIRNLLGGVFLTIKDNNGAREQFQQALKLKADFYPAMLNLAKLDAVDGKFSEAAKWYQQILEKNKTNMAALMGMAQIERAQGKMPLALEWLERARQSDVGAVQPRIILARTALDSRDVNRAEELTREVLSKNPDNPIGLSLLGELLMTQGDYGNAETTLEKLVKIEPKSPNALLQLGQALSVLNKIDRARNSYREALKIEPDFLPAILGLANMEMRSGNTSAALKLADGMIKLKPNAPEGYTLRGDIMMVQKNFAEAKSSYALAAQKRPSTALAIKQYQALAAAGKASLENLTEPLHTWLESHPTDEGALLALADAHLTHQSPDQAINIYQRILQTNPNQITTLNNLALAYDATKNPRAKETAEKAYQLDANNPLIADTFGWVLLRLGEQERGKQLLEQAFRELPNLPSVGYHLAVAKSKTGDIQGARELLTRTLASQEAFDERALAEELVRTIK